jgi:hypothetical protein
MTVRFGSGYLKFEDGGLAVRTACFCSLSVQVSECGLHRGLEDLNYIEHNAGPFWQEVANHCVGAISGRTGQSSHCRLEASK